MPGLHIHPVPYGDLTANNHNITYEFNASHYYIWQNSTFHCQTIYFILLEFVFLNAKPTLKYDKFQ